MIENPDYTEMAGGALLDACGADAMKWAIAFCQTKKKMGWTDDDIDVELMVAWFANAIETACRKRRPDQPYPYPTVRPVTNNEA